MGLWKIWLVGVAIAIVTSILVVYKEVKIHRIFVDILVATSIAVVGGIPEGWVISQVLAKESVGGKIVGIILGTIHIIKRFYKYYRGLNE